MAQDRAGVEARISALLAGKDLAGAATEALRGYGEEILGYLISLVRDDAAGRDVFSGFSEDLWKGIGKFRQQCTFRTWAYKLALNAARMYWRDPFRRRVRRLETSEYSLLAERLRVSSVRTGPDAHAGRLEKLRASLTPDELTLLILRVDRALSWKEIADVLAEGDATPAVPAALRKRFERMKDRLVHLAEKEHLLEPRSRGR